MTIQDQIKLRRSVRTYSGEPLSEAHTAQIREFVAKTQAPFGVKAGVQLIEANQGPERLQLGTYGWVSNAPAFLALVYEKREFDQEAAAYMFEQIVLFCTGLGLGTCWLGGSFSRSDFKKHLQLKENESVRIVSPVGYQAGTRRWFLEKFIVNADKKHATRKPFSDLFFDKTFDAPLTVDKAGIYATPLEMVRLSPSANNKQEWRIVLDDNALHFFKSPYPLFDRIDIGIALCHFAETCKELNIKGKFDFSETYPVNNKLKYVISWIKS
jgi:nitroreductase